MFTMRHDDQKQNEVPNQGSPTYPSRNLTWFMAAFVLGLIVIASGLWKLVSVGFVFGLLFIFLGSPKPEDSVVKKTARVLTLFGLVLGAMWTCGWAINSVSWLEALMR